MRPVIRATVIPFALLAFASMACQSDVKPVGDVLAHDSTLALEVYGARPDSVHIVDADVALFDTATVAASVLPEQAAPARAASIVEAAPAPAAPIRPAPARRPVVETSRRSQPRTIATTASNTRTRPVAASRSNAVAPVENVPSRAWLVLPVGTQLEFESERQVCTNDSESFVATLTESVVRAGGTIVPEGASARGEIVANDESDSGISMRVQWITFAGRAYAVKTRVTEADTRRARERTSDGRRASCIPRGGRILAELTQPMRVLLTGE